MNPFYQNKPNKVSENTQLALILSVCLFVALNFFLKNFLFDAFVLSFIFFAIIDTYQLANLIMLNQYSDKKFKTKLQPILSISLILFLFVALFIQNSLFDVFC